MHMTTVIEFDIDSEQWIERPETLERPREEFAAVWVSDEFAQCRQCY